MGLEDLTQARDVGWTECKSRKVIDKAAPVYQGVGSYIY